MSLLISWSTYWTSVVRDGYLFCRKCLCRTPGEMVLAEEVTYLWGVIPLGETGASRNLLRCGACDSTFAEDDDWGFDFGDHVAPGRGTAAAAAS